MTQSVSNGEKRARIEELESRAARASAGGVTPSIQAGTATLVAGTVAVPATITATSLIIVTMRDPGAGAITGLGALDVPVATRVVGAPGSFTVNAIDDAKALINTAVSTFDWIVID